MINIFKKCFTICFLLIIGVTLFAKGQPEPDRKEAIVYSVVSSGIEEKQAQVLARYLGLQQERLVNENGVLDFLDSKSYQAVPSKLSGEVELDEDGNKIQLEILDIVALRKLEVISTEKALDIFASALKKSGLLPEGAKADTYYTSLNFLNAEKREEFSVKIDTVVKWEAQLNGVPLVGPGSVISANFSSRGSLSNLHYASRKVREMDKVQLLTQEEVVDIIRRKYNNQELQVETSLVYYAPELSLKSVRYLLPYYNCVITDPEGKLSYLEDLIPAAYNSEFVPELQVKLDNNGDMVTGSVDIKGGQEPYIIQWNINGEYKTRGNQVYISSIYNRNNEYDVAIPVTVTDGNGVAQTVTTSLTYIPSFLSPTLPPVAADTDFGTENAVTNQFGDLEQGFVNEMLSHSVTKRYQWKGKNAWERDFKYPHDVYYTDETDITFYVGHGSPNSFTFEDTTHDDSNLTPADANREWGNRDNEWMVIYSCQVLKKSPWKWAQVFDGLHLLLGFHTLASVNNGFSGAFASNMLDKNMTVRQAWFKAVDTNQPSGRTGVVMGAGKINSYGQWVWNYNDHFWGHGSVGVDIDKSEIDFYWYVSHTH
ncbi:MAG: hypothetical protein JXR70_03680 [Spirochaetales bacterium]|nr:hypothetical protein [Spirochaetales bacterium]